MLQLKFFRYTRLKSLFSMPALNKPSGQMTGPRLITGLGNPGNRYSNTRHNMGFLVLDHVMNASRAEPGEHVRCLDEKNEFILWEWIRPDDPDTRYLLKPMTYMNRSGKAVAHAASRLNLREDKILVIHDEVDLPLGRVKLKFGGGLAGHNGLRSIAEQLGTRDFARLRIGIGRPEDQASLSEYVLHKFTPGEQKSLQEALDKSLSALSIIFTQEEQLALQRINSPSGN